MPGLVPLRRLMPAFAFVLATALASPGIRAQQPAPGPILVQPPIVDAAWTFQEIHDRLRFDMAAPTTRRSFYGQLGAKYSAAVSPASTLAAEFLAEAQSGGGFTTSALALYGAMEQIATAYAAIGVDVADGIVSSSTPFWLAATGFSTYQAEALAIGANSAITTSLGAAAARMQAIGSLVDAPTATFEIDFLDLMEGVADTQEAISDAHINVGSGVSALSGGGGSTAPASPAWSPSPCPPFAPRRVCRWVSGSTTSATAVSLWHYEGFGWWSRTVTWEKCSYKQCTCWCYEGWWDEHFGFGTPGSVGPVIPLGCVTYTETEWEFEFSGPPSSAPPASSSDQDVTSTRCP